MGGHRREPGRTGEEPRKDQRGTQDGLREGSRKNPRRTLENIRLGLKGGKPLEDIEDGDVKGI